MATILDRIVARKWEEIRAAQARVPLSELEARLEHAPPTRDFFAALDRTGSIQLIAEVKKASPSQGVIRADFDPVAIAQAYADNGAACISVLTDETFFQGSLAYLTAIRSAVPCPVLRKDFILDPYQLVEARAAGADAVLLIAECLDDCNLRGLIRHALELNLCPLVELYEPENVPRVLEAGATLIGVNNRDLRTFQVDLQHTVRMREQIPADCLLVGESGVESRRDLLLLQQAGVDAVLVGESLMRRRDVGAAVRELLGGEPAP